MNADQLYAQTLILVMDDVRRVVADLDTLQKGLGSDIKEVETSLTGEELQSGYAEAGKKYTPLFAELQQRLESIRSNLMSLKPPRKYRKKHVSVLESVKYLDDAVGAQATACRLLAEGAVDLAVESLLTTRPLMAKATAAIGRF